MIVPFGKDPLLLPFLNMAGMKPPPRQRINYNIPDYEPPTPTTAETMIFRKTKARRKITRASRKKNRR